MLASPTTRIASAMAAFWPAPLEQVADRAERLARSSRAAAWSASVSAPAARDRADVLRRHRDRAVDQVAPAGDQLVVVAADELRPGEVGVLRLRPGDGDEVAQRVGVVARQEVADVDDHLRATRRTCGPPSSGTRCETTSVGRLSSPSAPGRRRRGRPRPSYPSRIDRPDHRVEDDVVLAHEVVATGPPGRTTTAATPRGRRCAGPTRSTPTGSRSPRRTRRRAACRLGRSQPVERDRDAPVEVAGDRPRLQVVEQVLAELQHVGPPVGRGSAATRRAPRRSAGRSRKKCSVSTNSGVSPLIFDCAG